MLNLRIGQNPSSTYVQQKNRAMQPSKTPSFGDALLIIKPEAFHRADSALAKIKDKGYEITNICVRKLTGKEVETHYKVLEMDAQKMLKEGSDFLDKIHKKVIANMQKGEVLTGIIKGDDKVASEFKGFVGATSYKQRDPKSLRGQIQSEMVEEWTKQGKSASEIEQMLKDYTFIHASDTNFFPGTTIKNYDYEIANLYPNIPVQSIKKMTVEA